jgi:hypothetical protein
VIVLSEKGLSGTNEGPVRRVSSLFIVIILVTLILSIAALYQAIEYYITQNNMTMGSWFLFLGFTGLALSTYMVLQSRRRPVKLPFEAPKVVTTIVCEKCDLKNIRDFARGDYVFKETEPCPKCNENMLISAIYREVTDKEKS